MKDPGDNDDGRNGSGNTGTGIVTKTRPKTKKPSLYKVLLLNDDYTPDGVRRPYPGKDLRQDAAKRRWT